MFNRRLKRISHHSITSWVCKSPAMEEGRSWWNWFTPKWWKEKLHRPYLNLRRAASRSDRLLWARWAKTAAPTWNAAVDLIWALLVLNEISLPRPYLHLMMSFLHQLCLFYLLARVFLGSVKNFKIKCFHTFPGRMNKATEKRIIRPFFGWGYCF